MLLYLYTQQFIQFNVNYVGDYCQGWGIKNYLIPAFGNQVLSKIKKPHFAHKTVLECNGETYLHRLGKRAFFETYQKCLAENEPFYITFHVPKKCQKFKNPNLGNVHRHKLH